MSESSDQPLEPSTEGSASHRPHWFGKTSGWLGFGPLTWQGRLTVWLYGFLVVTAVFLYSSLSLTALVIVFYTVVALLIVVFTSELRNQWPPQGPAGSSENGDTKADDDRSN